MGGSQRTIRSMSSIDYQCFLPLTGSSDEHQRRSPDCLFFTLSTTEPKAGRAKKGRASNTSRLSTQSNFTAVTEGMSIAETEANQDGPMVSTVDTVQPTKSGKGGKKATKAKKGAGKAKGKVATTKQEESQSARSIREPAADIKEEEER